MKNIKDKIVGNVLESILEVRNNFIVCLLEVLIFRIAFAHFISEYLTDNVNQNIFKSHLITVLILESSCPSFIGSHGSDGLVCSLDIDLLHITDRWLLCEADALSPSSLIRINLLSALGMSFCCCNLSVLE